jgi:hypothetical protein
VTDEGVNMPTSKTTSAKSVKTSRMIFMAMVLLLMGGGLVDEIVF